MKRRWIALIAALALLLCGAALAEGYRIDPANGENFGALLVDLLRAYETPREGDAEAIEAAVEAVAGVNAGDGEVARAIADHWNRVYVNADGSYRLYLYGNGERAVALEEAGVEDRPAHAFVVLGFELKDGGMTDELKGRCRAAAAAARSFPSAILVCSGGATGKNNPKGNTEAGLMKAYLAGECGIDAGRIFTDERAMTTLENAVNTFAILREQGVESYTVVTSSYHQRWGQVLYNAMGALYNQVYGYDPQLVGNYSFPVDPGERFRHEDRIAVRQLTQMLGLPDEVVEGMKQRFEEED